MKLIKRSLTSPPGNVVLGAMTRVRESRIPRDNSILRVLTYHRVDRVDAESPLNPRLISATPNEFAQQVDAVLQRYVPVSMKRVLNALEDTDSLPARAVLFTFDDAYRCFADNVWPVLKSRDVPATLFVATGFPDTERRFWWDRLYASAQRSKCDSWTDANGCVRRFRTRSERGAIVNDVAQHIKMLRHDRAMQCVDETCASWGKVSFPNPVLTWREIRDLAEQGVEIAPHTRHHPLLSRMSRRDACTEAVQSYRDLREHLPSVPRVIAYPGGSHDASLAAALRRCGFRVGLTVNRGTNRIGAADPLRLNRINVGRGTTPALLRAQLLTPPKALR